MFWWLGKQQVERAVKNLYSFHCNYISLQAFFDTHGSRDVGVLLRNGEAHLVFTYSNKKM